MEPLEAAIEATRQIDSQSPLVAAKCRALMVGYDARWIDAGYVPESAECVMTSDLYNPDTQSKSRSFRLAGKLDVRARYAGRKILFDHKSTSQDITDPNAPYWRQLVVEGQVTHYMLLEWLNGEKCDDAVWDVIRKPAISPKKLTKAEIKAVVSLGEYFDLRVSEHCKQWFIAGNDRETVEMYEARLAHDCTKERPEWYFARKSIPRTDGEVLEYARELWQHSKDMLYSRQQARLPPRNSGACMLYGSPCKFLGICSGYDTPDSDRWQRKDSKHPELPMIDGDILTNSRIRCFQTCRRKHYYEYELGIERQDEEEREALFFGTALHLALEAWWKAQIPEIENDGNCNAPASGASDASRQSQLAG